MEVDIVRIDCKTIREDSVMSKYRQEALAIRYEVFCKEMKVVPPNDREVIEDEYDYSPFTIIFLARVEGKAVGTLRLVKYTDGIGLPLLNSIEGLEDRLERAIDFRRRLYGGRTFSESGRLVLLKEYRKNTLSNRNRLISLTMMSDYISYCRDYGITDVIGIANPKLLSFYERIGLKALFYVRDKMTGIPSPIIHSEVDKIYISLKRLKFIIVVRTILGNITRYFVRRIR
jgi:N-acyl-L-homoserine lactone synthetase